MRVSGDLLLVEVQGEMNETVLRECQQRVLELAHATGLRRVLYDARAIVVPGTRLAYLARIAFFEGEDRVFYDDIDAARAWLREGA